jgi:hypothetical protein
MNRPADALRRRELVTASAGAGALAATSHLLPSVRAGSPGPQRPGSQAPVTARAARGA